jgi:hypothetical protein
VGHAKASIGGTFTRILDGKGYGTQITGVGAASGKTALVHLPCHGTEGVLKRNITAGITIPNVISTGTEKSTATGVATQSSANGTTTAAIQNVSLINIISADVVKAVANVSSVGKSRTFNDTGSTFGNLSVLGVPTLPDPVPPNTVIDIPNVGTLYLHRVIEKDHHIEVRMIELVISVPVGPLAVGTDIRIGVAEVSVHSG